MVPAAASTLAQSISGYARSSPGYFADVQKKVKGLVESGQLGIFAKAYWGHPAYKLPPEANLMAVAHYLATEAGIDPDEIAEVSATHYLDAHEADPDAADSAEVRAEARRWFTRAADRAASLAASLEAQRAFERAAGLTDEGVERGRSLARAGELAVMGGRVEEAVPLLEEAIDILGGSGLPAEAAAAQVRLGEVLFITNRIEEAVGAIRIPQPDFAPVNRQLEMIGQHMRGPNLAIDQLRGMNRLDRPVTTDQVIWKAPLSWVAPDRVKI